MSEEKLQPGAGQEGFEQQDLSASSIFYFMVGLAAVIVLTYFIVAGMYRYLDSYDKKHEAPMNPMVKATNEDSRRPTNTDTQRFPEPRLEQHERGQLGDVIQAQDKILDSYDWVDQKNGVVRIPIDKAMELLAQRRLPVRPQESTPGKKETKAKPAPKAGAPGN
jgi:hypothetical protein